MTTKIIMVYFEPVTCKLTLAWSKPVQSILIRESSESSNWVQMSCCLIPKKSMPATKIDVTIRIYLKLNFYEKKMLLVQRTCIKDMGKQSPRDKDVGDVVVVSCFVMPMIETF